MPNGADLTGYLKEIGEAFKLGSGVLGKSAIALGVLIAVGGLAIFRLKSDEAILLVFGIVFVAFFLWFFPVIRFVDKHPDAALLDGAEWRGWKQFEAGAKGYVASAADQRPASPSGTEALVITVNAPKPDEEPQLHG